MEDVKNQFKAWGFPKGRKTANPVRTDHLDFLRKRRDNARYAPFRTSQGPNGYLALSMPELDYYCIVRMFPDLNSKDAEIKRKAWDRFIESPLSAPYRVSADVGKRKEATGIIVK